MILLCGEIIYSSSTSDCEVIYMPSFWPSVLLAHDRTHIGRTYLTTTIQQSRGMGVCLPSTRFNQQKPEILTLKPLQIPPGHNAGPFEVSSNKKAIRKRSLELHCVSKRTQQTEDGAD